MTADAATSRTTLAKPQGPDPRACLQLRWEPAPEGHQAYVEQANRTMWLCHYELVLPLKEGDPRCEIQDDDGIPCGWRSAITVSLDGPTLRNVPLEQIPGHDRYGRLFPDMPVAAGERARTDALMLGLPLRVVVLTGYEATTSIEVLL